MGFIYDFDERINEKGKKLKEIADRPPKNDDPYDWDMEASAAKNTLEADLDYYDCKTVYAGEAPFRWDSRNPSKRMGKRCIKTTPKKYDVTIDIEEQLVWFHGSRLTKEKCEILDKKNFNCLSLDVVNGKPIDTEGEFFK